MFSALAIKIYEVSGDQLGRIQLQMNILVLSYITIVPKNISSHLRRLLNNDSNWYS